MLNRIVFLLVPVLFVVAVPGDARADVGSASTPMPDDLVTVFTMFGLGYTGVNIVLSSYNSSRLNSGDPSKLGGIGGVLLGPVAMFYGAACVLSGEPSLVMTGAGCLAAGTASTWYGVKSLKAVQRQYIEAEERGFTIVPALIDDGAGKLEPGVQLSWKF